VNFSTLAVRGDRIKPCTRSGDKRHNCMTRLTCPLLKPSAAAMALIESNFPASIKECQ